MPCAMCAGCPWFASGAYTPLCLHSGTITPLLLLSGCPMDSASPEAS